MAAAEFAEIVALQDHVVEFEEGQRLLAVQPQLDRIERQHAVDGEVDADLAQQRDVAQRVEPVGVVGEHGVGGAVAEAQERGEAAADAGHVGGDGLVGEQLADSSLPEGSPIRVVPPPSSTSGRWPCFCSSRRIMICTRLPTCRLSAVQSKPI